MTASTGMASVEAKSSVDPSGLWRNPAGTLQVRIAERAGQLTGTIAWAAPEAIADARESGVNEPLVGTALLQDYRRTGSGRWQGRVYVPDMQATFVSNIKAKTESELDISGCILGGLLCKHQTWRRV
ncbi:MAG: DUF2147 domain-containing protein [Proteobacteria bacterium]|nr:DUF2147 domain-containing protein [Pseudomonadota bacterium]MDE2412339.1 DUF2147 domain-containing protein [Sphingomonadales bacterium]